MKIDIKIATMADVDRVQAVLLHKEVASWLGGMTMRDQIKDLIKQTGKAGVWYAEADGQVVGTMLVASRPQAFQMKYGSLGVLPEFRRRRVANAMYACMTLQGLMEGRRYFEDSIVDDNPNQFAALPKMGLNKVGYLRDKIGSGKSLCLFDYSLLSDSIWTILNGVANAKDDFTLHIIESWYTDEVREVNLSNYEKKLMPEFSIYIQDLIEEVKALPYVSYSRCDVAHPTDVKRARDAESSARKLME